MAGFNPTRDQRVAPLELSDPEIALLRERLGHWLQGLREELEDPGRLKDPRSARREARSYERMLVSLTTRQIVLPDPEALGFLAAAARTDETASEYAEAAAAHDALQALLSRLESQEQA